MEEELEDVRDWLPVFDVVGMESVDPDFDAEPV